MKAFFAELRRRNVVRMGVLYAVGGWLLLQVADVLFGLLELPGWSLRLVLGILILGFPLLLVFAWVYEMTPEGLRRAKEVEPSRSITPVTGQKLNTAIVSVLTVALLLTLGERLLNSGQAPAPHIQQAPVSASEAGVSSLAAGETPSIAVLPFVNMSGESENEYFSDGLSEELLNVLAQVPGLRVAARTSSFQFKGQTGDVADIGRQLKVKTILEGSVRRAGERVRVTAQLINVSDGYHLWSSTYDRQMLDVFAIQDEIANKVVEALRITLLGDRRQELTSGRTKDFEAYNEYLMARQFQAQESYSSLVKAEELYKQVLARDPNYRDALTALVETHLDQALTGKISYREAQTEARPWLEQVRRLDAERGDERGDVLGLEAELELIAFWANINTEAERKAVRQRLGQQLSRAIELNPNGVRAYQRLAQLKIFDDDFDGAGELLAAARQLDPLSLDVSNIYLRLYRTMSRFDLAAEEVMRMQQLNPGSPTGYWLEADLAAEQGDFYRAVRAMEKARQVDPEDHELAAAGVEFYLAMGDIERAAPWLDKAVAMAPNAPDTYRARLLLAMARDEDAKSLAIAREILARQIENRSGAQFFAGAVLAWDAYSRQDYDAVLEWLRTLHEASFVDAIQYDMPGDVLFALTWVLPVLEKAGQAGRAKAVLEAAQGFVDGFDFVAKHEQWRQARLESILRWYRGGGDTALEGMAQSLEARPMGSLWWVFLQENPLVQDMVGAAPVAAEIERMRARYASMAQRLREEDGYRAAPD